MNEPKCYKRFIDYDVRDYKNMIEHGIAAEANQMNEQDKYEYLMVQIRVLNSRIDRMFRVMLIVAVSVWITILSLAFK